MEKTQGILPDHPERSVCFTGHRWIDAPESVRLAKNLRIVIRTAAEYGYTDFYCGGALGFDTLAAEAVLSVRKSNPAICLRLIIPCRNQAERWPAVDRIRYRAVMEAADEVVILSEKYDPGCMMARNMYMVNHASVCICYLKTMRGGTWSTVRYAVQNNLSVCNLAVQKEPTPDVLKEGPLWSCMFTFPSAKRNAVTAPFRLSAARKGLWRSIRRH